MDYPLILHPILHHAENGKNTKKAYCQSKNHKWKCCGFSNDFIKRQRGWYAKCLNNEAYNVHG